MAFTLSMLEEFRSEGCQVTWKSQVLGLVYFFRIHPVNGIGILFNAMIRPVKGNLREVCCKVCHMRSIAGSNLNKKPTFQNTSN